MRSFYPQGESNPCFRTENPESWATRRWGPMASGQSSQFQGRLSRSRTAVVPHFDLGGGGLDLHPAARDEEVSPPRCA
jgi:hypothetical protein